MNNDNKQLVIHFNNGSKMELSFPTQVKNSLGALVEVLKRALEADKLVIQTEDRVLVIPWSSIKYVDTSGPVAAALPLGAIKGARLISSVENSGRSIPSHD